MLQIQKQNIFLRQASPDGVGAFPPAPEATRRISGTPEQQAVMKESREQRNALANETLKLGVQGKAVEHAQIILKLLGYYHKGIDGAFGSGTLAAVQAYQKDLGMGVDGAIGVNTARALVMGFQHEAGLKVDGIAGPNTKAALEKYRTGDVAANNNISAVVINPQKVETRTTSKNIFQKFWDHLSGKNRPNMKKFDGLQLLDNYIDASTPGFTQLEKSIHDNRLTTDATVIDALYGQTLSMIQGKVPANLYNTAASAKNTLEKLHVLDFVQNSRMGGTKSPENIRNNKIGEIISADDRIANKQDQIWAQFGINVRQKREEAQAMLKQRGQYVSEYFSSDTQTVLWSLRSKNLGEAPIGGLHPYAGNAIETVQFVDGKDLLPISISDEALANLVANLDGNQLTTIKRNVLKNSGYSDEKIKQMILDGTIRTKAFFAKSGNCFNDAIALRFVAPIKKVQESGGNGGGSVTTGPGVEGGVTTDPGVEGGGDEGGGGTGGGNDGGR